MPQRRGTRSCIPTAAGGRRALVARARLQVRVRWISPAGIASPVRFRAVGDTRLFGSITIRVSGVATRMSLMAAWIG